jgi:small conductance mechanosensitive channel
VYKVLENWYVTFAELTPKLIVGILVFTFFLLQVNILSQIAVKFFTNSFQKAKREFIGYFNQCIQIFDYADGNIYFT